MIVTNPFRESLEHIPGLNDALDLIMAAVSKSPASGEVFVDMEISTDGTLRSGATAFDVGAGFWLDYNAGTPRFRVGDPNSGYIAWNGSTLTIAGTVTISGYAKTDFSNVTATYAGSPSVGGAANSITGQGALATQNSAAWSTQVSSRPTELTDGRITTAINSAGLVISGVKPGINVTTGSAGLYLGADFMGYYNGSAWKTYMDNTGNFYLGGTSGSLTWNGTTLAISGTVTATAGTIGGWTIGASDLTGGNATLASSGNLTLGTANNVARLSADDATYRIWAGHATAASAPFSVDKFGNVVMNLVTSDLATLGAFSTQGACDLGISGAQTQIRGKLFRGTASAGQVFWTIDQSTSAVLTLGGQGTGSNTHAQFYNANGAIGSITSSGSTTSYNTSSDARLKDIQRLAVDVSVLRRSRVYDFRWKADGTPGRGVIAQDAFDILPQAVTPGEIWYVDYSKYVPDLIVGWQDLDARLRALEAR